MDSSAMISEFKFLLDKVDSSAAPLFLPTEIVQLLNISQDKFITKRMFSNNVRRTGFEEDQKRRDDLRTLIIEVPIPASHSESLDNKPNGRFFLLPKNYRHAIQEEAEIQTIGQTVDTIRRVSVKPITHDRYNKIIDDPFNKPEKDTVYRLDYGGEDPDESEDGQALKVELICGEGQVIDLYHLRYIKTPRDITEERRCTLPSHTHREIIRMAVVEALESIEQPRYQSSKIELNEIE